MRAWGAMLALSLVAAGCSPRVAVRRELPLETPAGAAPLALAFLDSDAEDAERVRQALERALPRLSRWGALREPVHVELLPSHEALEAAAERPGHGWLRAWGRYGEVLVQAPRTWGLLGASQAEIDELLAHELTHCLMYQLAADRLGWTRKGIPLWFREGMASYTAGQGARWPDREALSRALHRWPQGELFGQADSLVREQPQWVYGAAHHAFTFLVERQGEATLRALLREMQRGPSFSEAFEEVVGLSPEAFLREFTHHLEPGRR